MNARHYIWSLVRDGKVQRIPCELCGAKMKHFHHLDYEDKTTNVLQLCFQCHVLTHIFLRLVADSLKIILPMRIKISLDAFNEGA
jgi:hypothetical protein